jgi:hypothetical protein
MIGGSRERGRRRWNSIGTRTNLTRKSRCKRERCPTTMIGSSKCEKIILSRATSVKMVFIVTTGALSLYVSFTVVEAAWSSILFGGILAQSMQFLGENLCHETKRNVDQAVVSIAERLQCRSGGRASSRGSQCV